MLAITVEKPHSEPVRVCVFGAAPDADWQTTVGRELPPGASLAPFPHAAGAAVALRAAAAAFPGDDLILLRAGTTLPPCWYERLVRALQLPQMLVAAPLDNTDPACAPLPSGASSNASARTIDALCYAYGSRDALAWPTFSPLLSIWSGNALRGLDLDAIGDCRIAERFAPLRSLRLDHLYVADPALALRGPQPAAPGDDAAPLSALGELREAVAVALATPAAGDIGYPGLDAKPVVLHVLHGWGGGAERLVRDLAATDAQRHHLVFMARGDFGRRRYGEVLELHDAMPGRPPLRRLVLSDPIASTRLGDGTYRAFLDRIVGDFGVDAVMISSLIGHSLDALRGGLPTSLVIHDAYPLWPLLHRNLDDASATFDAAELAADLAGVGAAFEFAERDADYWLALREAFADAARAADARLIAPSRSALAIFLKLQPRLSTLRQSVIPHGMNPWPAGVPLPAPPTRTRPRLLVLGRVRAGKGAQLLRAVLPRLYRHADVFLVGAGAEASEFFGRSAVHIVLNYSRDELPALLGRIAPDAALMLPALAETFSYTLSELRSLGIPVIATRLGALAERIRDGVDGFLVPADADAIVTKIASLCANPSALAGARATLAQLPQRTLADMVADYRELLPAAPEGTRYALAVAGPDRLRVQTYAAVSGDLRRDVADLKRAGAAQQRELERRADWALGLDRQLTRAGREIERLRDSVEERTAWARAANDSESRTRAALEQLRREFDERSDWALALDAQLEAMRASTSWRATRPLRYAKRKLLVLRTRLRYSLGRLRAIVHRTRGSLASRGLAGTVRRAVAEFRTSAPLTAPLSVAAPTQAFTPFAVPTSAGPQVSIVIPVYNKIEYTVACLRSIAEHADATALEVIVVDDASSDATEEHLAQIQGVRVLCNARNLGFIGSCTHGAQNATGEFVFFLNNDTVVTAGWLEALLRCAAEEPDAGMIGAKLVYPDGRLQEAGGIVCADGSGWNYGRFEDPHDPRFAFRREADYCSGAAILLRRELFLELGGFDTRYAPAYYEDTDLAFAVRQAGKRIVYEPRATIVHFEGITSGTDTASGIKRHQVTNRGVFVEKWKSALAAQPPPIADARRADAAANWRSRGRVLIVDAYTPTPDQDSGSLRMLNLMRLLREMGYAVNFLPDNRAHAGHYTEALQALGVEALYHPFVADPVAWLRQRGRELDAIVLSRHYVATNYVGLARLYAPQARLIFDTVDLHFLREQRAAELERSAELAQQAARTRTHELKLMRECDISLVVSAIEKELLARELPQARVEILSNVHAVHGRRRAFGERSGLVFVGGFQHPPNIDAVLWFVREVFPRVRAQAAEIQFHVIDSKAPRQILELAHDGVTVHGYVDDIAPFMDGCRLSVAPLRYGAGVKGKVNMAMSYGLPVVATTPAVEGMHVRHAEDVMVADTPQDFAAAVLRAYDDAALWQTLSDNGLANVSRHFSFDAAREALGRILPSRGSGN